MGYTRPPSLFLVTFSLLCFQTVFLNAQPGSPEPIRSNSELHFGGPGSDGANEIIRLADGGFALGGWKARNGLTDLTESWVVRVDSRGAYVWDLPLPESAPYGITAMSSAFDGGLFTIDGHLSKNQGRTRLSKLSQEGALEWQHEYGRSLSDEISAIRPTFDGGLIMAGRIHSNALSMSDGWVVKLDRDMAVQWFRVIDFEGQEREDALEDLVVLEDGTYVAVGWSTDAEDRTRGLALKLSKGGATLYQRFHDLGPNTEFHKVQAAPNNTVVIAATTSAQSGPGRRVILGSLAQGGTLSWQQGIASQTTALATGLTRVDRTSYLSSVSIEDQQGQAGLIITFTSDGALRSIQRHAGDNAHRVLAVSASSGLGYATAGSSQNSTSLDQDMWLLISTGAQAEP